MMELLNAIAVFIEVCGRNFFYDLIPHILIVLSILLLTRVFPSGLIATQ